MAKNNYASSEFIVELIEKEIKFLKRQIDNSRPRNSDPISVSMNDSFVQGLREGLRSLEKVLSGST